MDVHAPEGRWWLMDGTPGEGELVLEQIGPPLQASRQGRVILCGYVAQDGLPAKRWRVVQVAEDDAPPKPQPPKPQPPKPHPRPWPYPPDHP